MIFRNELGKLRVALSALGLHAETAVACRLETNFLSGHFHGVTAADAVKFSLQHRVVEFVFTYC